MNLFQIPVISLASLCVFFVSCIQWGSKENSRLMQQALLLAEMKPDSALLMLDMMNTALFSDVEKSEFTLLRVQAKDNAGLDLSTDIEIFQVRRFFINKKDWGKAALACFYSGKTVDETDNVELEMNYFREALEFAKRTNNELLQGKILCEMGYVDFNRLWYDDAITLYRQALKIYRSAGNQYQLEVYSLLSIGNSFTAEHKIDSAKHYLDAALNKAQTFDDRALLVKVYNSITDAYKELKMPDTAMFMCRQALGAATTDKERAEIYMNLARLFHQTHFNDSARYYIVKAEPLIVALADKYELANFYHLHYQIELNDGNYPKALEYFELYAQYRLEITDWNDRQKLFEFQRKHENAERENKYNKQKSRLWNIVGIFGMVSLLLSLVVFRKQKKILRQKLELAKAWQEKLAKETLLVQTEREKIAAEQNIENLRRIFQKRNNEMQALFLEKLGVIKEIFLVNAQKTTPAKFAAEVDAIISKISLQQFITITNGLYPGFTGKLKEKCPNASLTEQEMSLCCLIACGFSNKEMALFIHKKKDTQAIDKMKNRIRKKLDIPAYGDIRQFLLYQIASN